MDETLPHAHPVETRWIIDNRNGFAVALDKVTHFQRLDHDDAVRVYFTSFGHVDLHHVDFDHLTEQLVMNL